MRQISTRRAAMAVTAVLAAAVLPLAAPAAPAVAADPCTSEAQPTLPGLPIPIGAACDDTVPPTTTLGTVTPAATDGWVRATAVSIAFSGQHTDADTDPISFECQLFTTATPPNRWQSCTSPVTYDKLDQGTPYTFQVRAVDTPDHAHDITADPLFAADTDLPDADQTPAELAFRADVDPPDTSGFLRSNFYDEDRQDAPMVTSPSVQIRLQGADAVRGGTPTYRCRLNDKPIACTDGITTVVATTSGMQHFTAAAVDPAGNIDPSPYAQDFFVPRNLTLADATRASRDDWSRVRGAGTFGSDYLETRTYGAAVTFPVSNIRAIRLLAPAGPGLGKVQVRVGRSGWKTVSLASPQAQRMKVYQVRPELSSLVAGPLQIRVASRNKPVRIDAVMAR